jgi:oxygen-independent coproporphyrinogen-3 oxidase
MYFGGGTPTYLNEWQITGLLARLRENIHMSEGIELTFESSPETITEEKLCHLKDIGVNRLSIGIQAFDDHLLLKVCNRGHNVKMAVSAITQAKKVGFKNGVNIDLIYGLPDQTPKGWMQTLSKAKELMPEFITLYHLRIKKGTPMSRFSEGRFPTEHNTLLMYIAGVDYLKDLGYVQIAPDQFALLGYSFQQQERKWRNEELLGLGVSAYGYVNNTVYHNVRSIQDYGDTVHRGCLPVYIGKRLSKREQMTRAMIFGLKLSGVNRKDGGLDKRLFKKAYGIDAESVFGEILIRLEKLGLIKRSNQHIQLTYKGILFSDEVCSEFYSSEEKEQLHRMGHKYGRGVF